MTSERVKFEFDQNTREDDDPILLLSSAKISFFENDHQIDNMRQSVIKNCDLLKMINRTNRVIQIKADKANFHFPFKYCFNDTFDHLIATFKMVKNIYKTHSEPFHPDSRLPPGLGKFRITQPSKILG